jgi:GAF domain-containing protein
MLLIDQALLGRAGGPTVRATRRLKSALLKLQTRLKKALILKEGNLVTECPNCGEVSEIFAASEILDKAVARLRGTTSLRSVLDSAIADLTLVCEADRGLIWEIRGDQLCVTHEFSRHGEPRFQNVQLGAQESSGIIFDFLSRFPDEKDASTIDVQDVALEALGQKTPELSSFLKLAEVHSRALSQLRSRGMFNGFIELQRCGDEGGDWSDLTQAILQRVTGYLSIVIAQAHQLAQIERDAKQIRIMHQVAGFFSSANVSLKAPLAKSVQLVAKQLGFESAQIFLYSERFNALLPQAQLANSEPLSLDGPENSFTAVYMTRKRKLINTLRRQTNQCFGEEQAVVLPLVCGDYCFGVMGLWKRQPGLQVFEPHEREFALTMAEQLAASINAHRHLLS